MWGEDGGINIYNFIDNSINNVDNLGNMVTSLDNPYTPEIYAGIGIVAVSQFDSRAMINLARKLKWPLDDLLDDIKKRRGRKKDWYCVASGYMIPSVKGTCCDGVATGTGAGNTADKAKAAAKKAANGMVPQGCQAKHLDVNCIQL